VESYLPEADTSKAAVYEELGPDGRRAYTVAEIAAEFGVSRPTIYRHLQPEAG
jgi:AcrR family transcriptional regulator